MNFCTEQKRDLQITKENLSDFKAALTKKDFAGARIHGELVTSFISDLKQKVEEFIPPPELVKVEFNFDESNFAYTGTNKLQCEAYDAAIKSIMDQYNLLVHMSTGNHGTIGYKGFVSLNPIPSNLQKNIIPKIHEEAEKVYKLLYQMGSHKA